MRFKPSRKAAEVPPPAPPDFADGREWRPLDPSDGRPRLLITLDPAPVGGEGRPAYHIDHWNLDPARLRDFYDEALPVVKGIAKEAHS